MSIETTGRYAEKLGRLFLKDQGFAVFQADWIANKGGKYICVEVKHQEPFSPPPFWGHGLPPYQAQARLRFQQITGIRCMLLVLDKVRKVWFAQFLDELEKGEHFDTNGKSPRRIYPLASFTSFTATQAELDLLTANGENFLRDKVEDER